MNKKLFFVATYMVIISGMIASLFVDVPIASAQDDPRSDKTCENMLDLEGKQDVRTEPDSTHPDSDQGARKAHEGSVKALGDCPRAP